jgi:hypothetical protein
MAKLSNDFASFSQSVCGERLEFVAVFLVTRKREYLAAQSHELDAILVIPPNHLDDISRIGKPQFLNKFASSCMISRLILIGAVLGSMLGLRGVFQRVPMFDDTRNSARSRAEHGGICVSKVGVETSLTCMLVTLNCVGACKART